MKIGDGNEAGSEEEQGTNAHEAQPKNLLKNINREK